MATKRTQDEELPNVDPADLLRSEESIEAFLVEAEQDPDPRRLVIAQGHVARARERWGLQEKFNASELRDFDPAHYLKDEEHIAVYLEIARHIGDKQLQRQVQGDVERARQLWGLPAPDVGSKAND